MKASKIRLLRLPEVTQQLREFVGGPYPSVFERTCTHRYLLVVPWPKPAMRLRIIFRTAYIDAPGNATGDPICSSTGMQSVLRIRSTQTQARLLLAQASTRLVASAAVPAVHGTTVGASSWRSCVQTQEDALPN